LPKYSFSTLLPSFLQVQYRKRESPDLHLKLRTPRLIQEFCPTKVICIDWVESTNPPYSQSIILAAFIGSVLRLSHPGGCHRLLSITCTSIGWPEWVYSGQGGHFSSKTATTFFQHHTMQRRFRSVSYPSSTGWENGGWSRPDGLDAGIYTRHVLLSRRCNGEPLVAVRGGRSLTRGH
jgi:hypothetical protein